MQVLVLFGLGAMCGVSIAVGAKLLWLARRTHSFPEAALGWFFLAAAGIGYPLSAAAAILPAWQVPLVCTSSVFTGSSQIMLLLFTARVFRAGDWRGTLGVAIGGALVVTYVLGYSISHLLASTPEDFDRAQRVWGGVSLAMSAYSYGWTGFESLRHYARHRRRVALGLADPVVANRMLLWGLMGIVTLVVVAVDTVLLYSGVPLARQVGIPLVTSAGGLAVGVLLLLAFFPPRAYLAAISRRAPTAA